MHTHKPPPAQGISIAVILWYFAGPQEKGHSRVDKRRSPNVLFCNAGAVGKAGSGGGGGGRGEVGM